MTAEFDRGVEFSEPSPYLIRYLKIERARDTTLKGFENNTPELAYDTFKYILGQQDKGIKISDPNFVKKHKSIIVASLPTLRIGLQQTYIAGLFDELLEIAEPKKRTPGSIPLNDEVNFIASGREFDYRNAELFAMYACLLGVGPEQITSNFKAVESVSIFLSAVADHTPLLPFPPKKVVQLFAPTIQVPDVGEVVQLPTNLPGISVLYAYEGNSETPETSLVVELLQ